MRENYNNTHTTSKGWTLDMAEEFTQRLRSSFNTPVRVKRVRADGRIQFIHTCVDVEPVENAELFVQEMEKEFGFTDVEYTYQNEGVNSVQMAIRIKIDNNGHC